MKEVVFLAKNANRWKEFENVLQQPSHDPDNLYRLFVQITDDLSFSRTFYPNSNTTAYLNSLAQKAYSQIYKNKKEKQNRIITFWKTELPLVMFSVRKQLLISFAIFSFAVLIGIVSTANDAGFVRLILGDAYVNMTEANIEAGDPMAVYKKMNEADMFMGITINNIYVSFLAFILGLFASFGTGYVLLNNGIMLGAFQYFFYQKGLLLESAKVIWIHGTLEISAIIIAGCAGIVLGNGLAFPGTYPRITSFMLAAKKGIKISIGLIPIFIIAAFLESFVTRYTGMPLALSSLIVIASLSFVLWYFIFYPNTVHKRFINKNYEYN